MKRIAIIYSDQIGSHILECDMPIKRTNKYVEFIQAKKQALIEFSLILITIGTLTGIFTIFNNF